MGDPINFTFFCTARDYPQFRALLQNDLPPTYDEFVALTNKRIDSPNTTLQRDASLQSGSRP
jgi:hypothetical protein